LELFSPHLHRGHGGHGATYYTASVSCFFRRLKAQASMMVLHNKHVENILKTLEDEGIAENTLVVWWSGNGPMYAFYPTSGYTLL
jgi:arylsulfatase A-like enzyme